MIRSGTELIAAAEIFGDAAAWLESIEPAEPWKILAATSQFRGHLGSQPDLAGMLACDQAALDLVFNAVGHDMTITVEVQLDLTLPPYPVTFMPVDDGWVVRLGVPGSFADTLRERSSSAARASNLANEVPIGLIYCANGVRSQWSNDRAADMVGLDPSEMAGLGWLRNMDEPSRDAIADASMALADGGDAAAITARLADDDAERHVVLRFAGTESGFVVTVEDVSEQVAVNRKLYDDARRDTLTGLTNRAGLTEALDGKLVECGEQQYVAALFLDLDGFKAVNDTYGHAAGDLLLIEVAQRLRGIVRPGDVAARLAGDEFVVALDKITSIKGAETVAQRILDAVSEPVQAGEHQMTVTPSIGIALAGGGESGQLIKEADAAMYRAKRAGKACYVVADQACW